MESEIENKIYKIVNNLNCRFLLEVFEFSVLTNV